LLHLVIINADANDNIKAIDLNETFFIIVVICFKASVKKEIGQNDKHSFGFLTLKKTYLFNH